MCLLQDRDQFVEGTFRPLFLRVRRQVGDPDVALDIVQTGYACVFARPDFDPSRPDASGFLWRKVGWLVQQHHRDRAHRADPLSLERPDPREPSPESAAATTELRALVRQAVERLDPRQQEVLSRWLAGMTHQETAADLSLPLERVYSLFAQAKRILRRQLQGER